MKKSVQLSFIIFGNNAENGSSRAIESRTLPYFGYTESKDVETLICLVYQSALNSISDYKEEPNEYDNFDSFTLQIVPFYEDENGGHQYGTTKIFHI